MRFEVSFVCGLRFWIWGAVGPFRVVILGLLGCIRWLQRACELQDLFGTQAQSWVPQICLRRPRRASTHAGHQSGRDLLCDTKVSAPMVPAATKVPACWTFESVFRALHKCCACPHVFFPAYLVRMVRGGALGLVFALLVVVELHEFLHAARGRRNECTCS